MGDERSLRILLIDDEPEMLQSLKKILAQRKEYSQAESVLDRYLGRDPNNLQALQAMARVRLLRQDWLGAQQIAEKKKNTKSDNLCSNKFAAARSTAASS